MGMLAERIQGEAREALKSGQSGKLATLRLIVSALQQAAKEAKADLTDDAAQAVLIREAKRRRESIDAFRKGGREDLAAHEVEELSIIEAYLPQPLSEEEIRALVARVVPEVLKRGVTSFGPVMGEVMKECSGRVDAALVSTCVKEALAAHEGSR
jgi:hypothetical protein